jgi:hypothetical protein
MTTIQRLSSLFLLAAALAASSARVSLLPRLQRGQVLHYLVQIRGEKDVKTESRVVAPMAPNNAPINAHGLLRIEVLDVAPSGAKIILHARASFVSLNPEPFSTAPAGQRPASSVSQGNALGIPVEFTISPGGSVQSVSGLETLPPEQQQAWREWVARFALAWTLPANGVLIGERWKSEETEPAEAPIAALVWSREMAYVRDEPCRESVISATGEISSSGGSADTCAVLLTTATLKQKSSPKDATPEAYKRQDLKTSGTAKGTNETFTYISLKTGLVVRATEEAKQFMDVVVAKADGTNRVHYNVNALSRSELLLVAMTPAK